MFTLDNLKAADTTLHVHSAKNRGAPITTLCSLNQFHKNGIIFVKNKKYFDKLQEKLKTESSLEDMGIIFQESFFETIHGNGNSEFLKRFNFFATVKSVDLAFSHFSKLFVDELSKQADDINDGRKTGTVSIHPTSSIADNVFLGKGVKIGANVIIHTGCVILSNSEIGEGTTLYPNVVVYRNVKIGRNCRIHANVTIGCDGFRYNHSEGIHHKVWHFGGVMIEDSVEIGSNSAIDQGTFSPTIIGKGSKIDNLVHIAHNCLLGKGVILCAQVSIAGSVVVGDYVVMGGVASVAPDVEIGNYAQIGGLAGVTGNVPEKATYCGHPARPLQEWLRSQAFLRKLSLKDRNTKIH